jgi:thiol-disulfide isomerase/thioredoxin
MNARNNCILLATFLLVAGIVYVVATNNTNHVFVLTKDTFFEQTEGKTVFIKFYTPGCEECKELDPVWEQLAAKWADHPQALVGEVDCALDGASKSWCANDLDLVEFPTLKYGDTSVGGKWLRTYEINRTFPIMYNFTNRTLQEPFCSPGNLKACSAIQKMEMNIQDKFNAAQLDTAIQQHERGIQLHVDEWVRKVEYFEKIEDRVNTNQALRVARMKTNLRILKECLAACLNPAWTNFTCPEKNETEEALSLEGKATDANATAATNSTNLESKEGNATDTGAAAAANTATLEGKESSVTDADAVAADTTEEHSEL